MSQNNLYFDNEDQMEDWLEKHLLRRGWIVERQAICEETRNWNLPYRADLIAFNPDLLKLGWVGFELKLIGGVNKGGLLGETIKQISKYRGKHFNNKEIKTWVYAFKNKNVGSLDEGLILNRINTFARELVNNFGIVFLNLNENSLTIEFCYSQPDFKIRLGDLRGYEQRETEVNVYKILDRIDCTEFVVLEKRKKDGNAQPMDR